MPPAPFPSLGVDSAAFRISPSVHTNLEIGVPHRRRDSCGKLEKAGDVLWEMGLGFGELAWRHSFAKRAVHDADGAFAPGRMRPKPCCDMPQECVQVHQECTRRLVQEPRLEGCQGAE